MEESENGDEWDGVLRVTHLFRGSDEGSPGGRSGRGRNLEEILDGVALSLLSAGHIFTARNSKISAFKSASRTLYTVGQNRYLITKLSE